MNWLKECSERYPILSFTLISVGITWAVWFCVPFFAGSNWALGRILVGAGFGPALAAIFLNHLCGPGANIGNRKWWFCFSFFSILLFGLYFSILITGDAITAEKFSTAKPVGITFTGVLGSIVSAGVGGFVIASLVVSRSNALNSISQWRISIKWWLIALLLPATWMLLGLFMAYMTGNPVEISHHGLDLQTWILYTTRSILLTFLVVAIGEESGWRAWMLPRLQASFSPLLSSVFLGLIWGLWHFPLFVIGQYSDPPEMVFAKAGACVMLGIIFTWLYNRTGGNLLMVVLLHTAMNSSPRLIPFSEQMGLFLFLAFVSMIIFDRMWRKNGVSNLDGCAQKT
ncbi:type II CAAX endopeptidase family protein [Thalassotalea psychrophila]|uniref:Type II CAAX endopeptidase family protein n=1 Tax=Thalassotalea psychrophila TaxID=3065647 RepID=A0ABY9TU50_9GAMM|nr:type II CAAX endopeptidase family protein [Colwelliaceae bacterium SQ149]